MVPGPDRQTLVTSDPSFGGDGERLLFVDRFLLAAPRNSGLPGLGRCRFPGLIGRRIVRRPQRLGQPARLLEQRFGLARHVRLLEMVDHLGELGAPRLGHIGEGAPLRHRPEIVGDGRPPAQSHHVQAGRAGNDMAMRDPVLDRLRRDPPTLVSGHEGSPGTATGRASPALLHRRRQAATLFLCRAVPRRGRGVAGRRAPLKG